MSGSEHDCKAKRHLWRLHYWLQQSEHKSAATQSIPAPYVSSPLCSAVYDARHRIQSLRPDAARLSADRGSCTVLHVIRDADNLAQQDG
jgi:hypothetical protein